MVSHPVLFLISSTIFWKISAQMLQQKNMSSPSISHSYVALDLVEKYCNPENVEDIQGSYLLSAGAFSEYLEARLERGEMIENKQ